MEDELREIARGSDLAQPLMSRLGLINQATHPLTAFDGVGLKVRHNRNALPDQR